MKTKERIAFEEMNNKINTIAAIVQDSIGAAVQEAINLGFNTTVELVSREPFAMGNYDLLITTSLNRLAQHQLSDLEALAIASEAAVKAEANIDCAVGLHSWVSETGIVDPNATCTACGERYGNPN